jgi:uncharacterized protein (DUF2267 family)
VRGPDDSNYLGLNESMRTREDQEEQNIPRIGNQVRFADGTIGGKVRELNSRDFVAVKGKKRTKRLVIPYSAVRIVEDETVFLRGNREEFFESYLGVERDGISKKSFIHDIDEHLFLDNPERAERITRIVLYLLSRRLSTDSKKKLKKSLPLGIRNLWASVEQPGIGQYSNMSDFLYPVKKQGHLQSMEEAFIVSREVFASLKKIMAPEEAFEISRALPHDLREIWESSV